jgi:hypothetical protein
MLSSSIMALPAAVVPLVAEVPELRGLIPVS